MPEIQTKKDSTTSTLPSEGSLPVATTISSHVPSPEMNAQSNDIAMSHVEERPPLDSADGEDSQSEIQGSATVQSHEDAKIRLTELEKLFKKLDAATIINHMDTGLALRLANNYQIEQSSPSEDDHQATTDTENEEAPEADSSHGIQNIATDAVSPSSAQISTSQSSQQQRAASITQPGVPRTIPNPYYSGIHYRRILVCVSIFVLGYQVLFALALGGMFGEWGQILALIFLVVLLTVSAVMLIDGIRQRMEEIKMEPKRT